MLGPLKLVLSQLGLVGTNGSKLYKSSSDLVFLRGANTFECEQTIQVQAKRPEYQQKQHKTTSAQS
jgi:hypothetical protein